MTFLNLPLDLKNVVCDFAYECNFETVENNVAECILLNKMEISSVFLQNMVWSVRDYRYIPSPLRVFEPISAFRGWAHLIDWDAVFELLWRLDFRRKCVKLVKSRDEWDNLFKEDWRNIYVFDSFYRFLLYTRVPCFKPLWSSVGFGCIKSYYAASRPLWWGY